MRGCSGDRWIGNVQIRIKQRWKQRAGREEGEEGKNRHRNKVYVSGWPPR